MNSEEQDLSINNILSNILKNYKEDKLKPFSSEQQVYQDFESIVSPLETLSHKINPNIKVKKSVGIGNWATIPWIAFLDKRETNTTQAGVYVVILFRADLSGFYVSFGHGVIKPKDDYGKRGAYKYFDELGKKIRTNYKEELSNYWDENNKIDLKSEVTAAKDYEAAIFAYKFFSNKDVAEDNKEVSEHLTKFINFYSKYISEKKDSILDKQKNQQVWVISPGRNAEYWDEFYNEKIIGIGWDEIGDLSEYNTPNELRKALKEKLGYGTSKEYVKEYVKEYSYEPKEPTNMTKVCYDFVNSMNVGDLIFTKRGRKKLIGAGIVTSDYQYKPERTHSKNIRTVDWLVKGEWDIDMIAMQTLVNFTNHPEVVEKYKKLLGLDKDSVKVEEEKYTLKRMSEETNFSQTQLSKWLAQLERKQHIIFQGPPGTGKTFIAEKLAKVLKGDKGGLIETVQFHPSYSYEDFIEGIRPELNDHQITYDLKPGRFLEFCNDARGTDGYAILIIDEINRANLSRVFGELMYLLEYRDKKIPLSGGTMFKIPDNVYLIGTMNTADRSIALVDHALRRRFTFIHIAPQYEILQKRLEEDNLPALSLVNVLKNINNQINDRNYEVGISYFMKYEENLKAFLPDIWEGEIEPYLEEYFFDQQDQVDAFRWEKLKEQQLTDWVD